MKREEYYKEIEKFLAEEKIGEMLIPRELVAELSERLAKLSLPPVEGAEANRASIDDLIKKHIPIDAANFEYCAKHNIINGGLLQGIRDVVNSFMKPQPTAEGAKEILEKHLNLQFKDTPEDWTVALIQFNQEKFIAAMQEYATLHAQRIADKMVSERLRNELMRYDQWLLANDMGQMFDDTMKCVDEYLNTREK